jgi:protein-S-isoprenylcysteine O-methyltransferase Ste14
VLDGEFSLEVIMANQSIDKSKLIRLTLIRLVGGIGLMAALFFLCAGTLDYWQAWIYLGLIALMMAASFIWLVRNDPERLERRMRTSERETTQKWLIGTSILFITLIFLLPGLDKRFAWSQVPVWLCLLGLALVIAGYGLYARVIRENRYASRVIEVVAGQKVITSGPYALVRHPMYLGMSILFLGTALGLGSYWTLLPTLAAIPTLAIRAVQEEKTLLRKLPGYKEYTGQVRWRLFPGVW